MSTFIIFSRPFGRRPQELTERTTSFLTNLSLPSEKDGNFAAKRHKKISGKRVKLLSGRESCASLKRVWMHLEAGCPAIAIHSVAGKSCPSPD